MIQSKRTYSSWFMYVVLSANSSVDGDDSRYQLPLATSMQSSSSRVKSKYIGFSLVATVRMYFCCNARTATTQVGCSVGRACMHPGVLAGQDMLLPLMCHHLKLSSVTCKKITSSISSYYWGMSREEENALVKLAGHDSLQTAWWYGLSWYPYIQSSC